jgi:alpha-L-rhamnosidase
MNKITLTLALFCGAISSVSGEADQKPGNALSAPTEAGLAAPVSLSCEQLAHPLGVDVASPRLGWVLESHLRGQRQTAYRILVASSAERLQRDEGDLWDSEKVESPEQNQIAYAGKPLAANTECFWKVQAWDQDGKASAWSAAARWGMGLLKPADWQAKWIGSDARASVPVEGCPWVWFPEGDPAENAPAGKRYFRKVVRIPDGVQVRSATMHATAATSWVCTSTARPSARQAIGKSSIGSISRRSCVRATTCSPSWRTPLDC